MGLSWLQFQEVLRHFRESPIEKVLLRYSIIVL